MDLNFSKLFKKFARAITPFYKAELALLITIMADVSEDGLHDDAALKEVQRRFRKEWKGVLRDSMLNFLIEFLVISGKLPA